MDPRRRLARLAIATTLLAVGIAWLLGDGFGTHVPAANAMLSMTSEAPFQVDPQPTAGHEISPMGGRVISGLSSEIAAPMLLATLIGIALCARAIRRRSASSS